MIFLLSIFFIKLDKYEYIEINVLVDESNSILLIVLQFLKDLCFRDRMLKSFGTENS